MGAQDGENKCGKFSMALGKAEVQTTPKLIQLRVCLSQCLVWEERKWGNLCIISFEEIQKRVAHPQDFFLL